MLASSQNRRSNTRGTGCFDSFGSENASNLVSCAGSVRGDAGNIEMALVGRRGVGETHGKLPALENPAKQLKRLLI